MRGETDAVLFLGCRTAVGWLWWESRSSPGISMEVSALSPALPVWQPPW